MPALSIRRFLLLGCATTVLWPTLMAAEAFGASDDKRFGQQVLEILREDGKVNDERYKALEELEKAEHEAKKKASERDPKRFKIKYSNGLQINRNDGQAKIKIGGRIQADFATIHVESSLRNALNTDVDPPDLPFRIGGDGEGVELRRTRLYISGDLYDRIVFKAQYDFAGGEVAIKDNYLGIKKIPVLGTILVGHLKEAFSLEQLTSGKNLTFMERSLASLFDAERNFGLMVKNHFLKKRMTAAVGIFMLTGDASEFFSRERDFNVSGRVTGLPYYDAENKRLIHLGFSVIRSFSENKTGGFSARPEIHLAERYLATGDFVTDGSVGIAVEFAAVLGRFAMQSEWKNVWLDRRDGNNWRANMLYVETSIFLTGDSKEYKTSTGIFDRVTPVHAFDPAAGGCGAWEVAVRYSWLDLQDEGMNGGEEQNITAAINWYLFSNVKLQLNYVYADVADTGDQLSNASGHIHSVKTRAQIEF